MGPAPQSSVYPRVLCLAPSCGSAQQTSGAAPGTDGAQGGTVGARIDGLTRHLDAAGVRVVVVCPRPRGAPRRERVGDRTIVRRLGATSGPGAALFPVAAAASLLLLARTADVLHVHHAADLAPLLLALSTARVWDIPLVITLHETHGAAPAGTGTAERIRRDVGQALEQAATRRATAVIVPTGALAERLAGEGVAQRRIRVVPPDAPAADAARQVLEIYRSVWAGQIARRVAIWHPTAG